MPAILLDFLQYPEIALDHRGRTRNLTSKTTSPPPESPISTYNQHPTLFLSISVFSINVIFFSTYFPFSLESRVCSFRCILYFVALYFVAFYFGFVLWLCTLWLCNLYFVSQDNCVLVLMNVIQGHSTCARY
jgi:hypothetical protein